MLHVILSVGPPCQDWINQSRRWNSGKSKHVALVNRLETTDTRTIKTCSFFKTGLRSTPLPSWKSVCHMPGRSMNLRSMIFISFFFCKCKPPHLVSFTYPPNFRRNLPAENLLSKPQKLPSIQRPRLQSDENGAEKRGIKKSSGLSLKSPFQ